MVFITGPPQFQYQKENCQPINQPTNQPITVAVLVNPVTKRGDWLIGNFIFGTEIREGQLKNHPVDTVSQSIR